MLISITLLFWLWVGTLVAVAGFIALMLYCLVQQNNKIDEEIGDRRHSQQHLTGTVQSLSHRADGFNASIEDHEQLIDDHATEFEHRLSTVRKDLNTRIDQVSQELVKSVGQCEIASEKAVANANKEMLEILDKALMGLRKDVDASISQRTNSITKYVDQSIQAAKIAAPETVATNAEPNKESTWKDWADELLKVYPPPENARKAFENLVTRAETLLRQKGE